jgi:hypothetical protein
MLRSILLVIALAFAETPLEAALQTEIRKVHLGPIFQGQSPYLYERFKVAAGATEITIHLDYDRAGGENAIDFAIFDARFAGRNDDLTGYRGKNSNRLPLVSVIGRKYASAGHTAGPLPPGTWWVMFYVYKAKATGVDATLRISVASEGRQEPVVGLRWYRGNLHTHTLHSDGAWTVSSLAAAARQAGPARDPMELLHPDYAELIQQAGPRTIQMMLRLQF